MGFDTAAASPDELPTAATLSNRTVSRCPPGHAAGSPDWLMGRLRTNVSPHWRQRNS